MRLEKSPDGGEVVEVLLASLAPNERLPKSDGAAVIVVCCEPKIDDDVLVGDVS